MAINERVGILTHVPGEVKPNPGLIGGIYGDYLTKELDFLDDSRNFPLASDFTSSPAYWFGFSTDPNAPGGDWEDLGGAYRSWRDAYHQKSRNYWYYREGRFPLDYSGYESIAKDPMPWKNSWNGSNAMEWIRRTVPSPVDGSFNYPYMEFPGAGDHYAFYNNRRGLFHRYLRHHQASLTDMTEIFIYKTYDSYNIDQYAPVATNVDAAYNFGSGFNEDANTYRIFRLDSGKILVAGYSLRTFNGENLLPDGSPCSLVRLNIDGTLDADFAPFATAVNIAGQGSSNIGAISADSNGKILIGGSSLVSPTGNIYSAGNIGLVRLNSDGTIDTQFSPFVNNAGGVDYEGFVSAIKVESSGTILVGGTFTSYGEESISTLVRLNSDGTINSTFSGLDLGVSAMHVYSDGKILMAGNILSAPGSCGLVRLNSDGTIDQTFSSSSIINFEIPEYYYISSIGVDSAGKIYVSGAFDTFGGDSIGTNFFRLNSDGTFDSALPLLTYSPIGQMPEGYQKDGASKLLVMENDKILLTGDFIRYGETECSDSILVINSDGTIDATYDFGMGFRMNGGGGLFVPDVIKVGNTIIAALGLTNRYYDPQFNTPGGIIAIKNAPVEHTPTFLRDAYVENRDRMTWLFSEKINRALTEEEEAELATRRATFLATDHTKLYHSLWNGDKAKQLWAYYVNNNWYQRYSCDTPSDYSNGNQIDTLDIWPADTTISEALGATGSVPYNRVPAVKSFSLLPATGSAGDVITITDESQEMAWDPIRGMWSIALFNRFFGDIITTGRATRDVKINADTEVALSMRPCLFASLYIPAFQITADGNINSELKAF